MAALLPNGRQQFIDDVGRPLVGGQVFFYEVGTEVPKDTWQDEAQTILNTNPVILDDRGQGTIFGAGKYRQVLKDFLGNLIWDKTTDDVQTTLQTEVDKVATDLATFKTDLASTGGAALVGVTPEGTLEDAIGYVTPEMFGAAGDGTTNDTVALQNALDYCLAHPKVSGILGYGCYAISTPIEVKSPAYGFSIFLRGLVTHADFPEAATWRTATAMIDVGTDGTGGPVGLNIHCEYVDGGDKADWIGINSYGCGGSHFHASRLSNVKIGVHYNQYTFVSSSNRITGEYWLEGYQAVRAGRLDGGTSTCEGVRVDVNFIANFRYGAVHLSTGAQYSEVTSQTDFNGKYLLEVALSALSFSALGRGDTITNGSKPGEVIAFYEWPVGTYKVLVAFPDSQQTTASWAAADTITTSGGFSNTVASVAKPGAANYYFDVIHDFQGFTFGKCFIRLSYGGGVVGGYLHSSLIEYYNSTYAFGLSYNGEGTTHSGKVLSKYDSYYNQQIWAHSKTGQGVKDTFSRLYNPLFMGVRRIYGQEISIPMASAVVYSVKTFSKAGDGTVSSTAEVWKVTVATAYHGVASEMIIHVYDAAITRIQIANEGGVISYDEDGMTLTAVQAAQDSLTATFNFQRIL